MILAEATRFELQQSWPLFEQSRHFDLGLVLSSVVTDALSPAQVGELGVHHAGCWECNLADESLSWSGGVFDLFGMPRSSSVARTDVLPLYAEHSRAAMERLRAHAIRYHRGFTLDIDLRPVSDRPSQRARLIAAPILENGRVVRLHGLKIAI